jgi:hypothetical protein
MEKKGCKEEKLRRRGNTFPKHLRTRKRGRVCRRAWNTRRGRRQGEN